MTEDEIEYILTCASTAPSAGNLESCEVIVITDDEVKAALAQAAFEQVHVEQACDLCSMCKLCSLDVALWGARHPVRLEDATIACTFMMLAAHAKNLHSCWTGAFQDDEVREILDLPQHIRPVALMAVGRGQPPEEKGDEFQRSPENDE